MNQIFAEKISIVTFKIECAIYATLMLADNFKVLCNLGCGIPLSYNTICSKYLIQYGSLFLVFDTELLKPLE